MILEQLIIPLASIRPFDIILLLSIGILFETITWCIKYSIEKKTSNELTLREQLHTLKYQTSESRRLGPQAFVETSKLERQLLNKEKKYSYILSNREERQKNFDSRKKKISLIINIIVFILYYGVPMFVIDGMGIEGVLEEALEEKAVSFYRGMVFPISVFGMGFKLSSFGMKSKGAGALVILWCGQVTVNKITECLDALLS